MSSPWLTSGSALMRRLAPVTGKLDPSAFVPTGVDPMGLDPLGELGTPDIFGATKLPGIFGEQDVFGGNKLGSLTGEGQAFGVGKVGGLDFGSVKLPGGLAIPPPAAVPPPGGTGSGTVGSLGGEYTVLDQYDAAFRQASAQYGVPVGLIKAVAATERGWEGTSPSGAQGLMQIMPEFWDGEAQQLGYDYLGNPIDNIMMGAYILKENYDQYGSWEMAAQSYLGLGGPDYYGTTSDVYWNRVQGFWDQIGPVGASTGGGSTGGGVSSIWGGQGDYPITQGMGLTEFAQSVGGYYDYALAYHGFEGHPGLDIGTPTGTTLYTPVSGTVIWAGGSGYYANYGNAGQGVGEFRIQLDNGDELILGHMSQINVQAGQRINAGTAIGLSGGENGDHVHVEYRQADGQGGFYIKDPNQMIGGGAGTGNPGQMFTQPNPGMSQSERLFSIAKGTY